MIDCLPEDIDDCPGCGGKLSVDGTQQWGHEKWCRYLNENFTLHRVGAKMEDVVDKFLDPEQLDALAERAKEKAKELRRKREIRAVEEIQGRWAKTRKHWRPSLTTDAGSATREELAAIAHAPSDIQALLKEVRRLKVFILDHISDHEKLTVALGDGWENWRNGGPF